MTKMAKIAKNGPGTPFLKSFFKIYRKWKNPSFLQEIPEITEIRPSGVRIWPEGPFLTLFKNGHI